MASEIRVDKINSLSGVGTVTLSPTGVDIAGITTAATLKATTGIVTTLTATTGIVTTFEATTGDITTLRTPTGIATHFTADKISLPDSSDGSLCIGIGSDFKINHNGTDSFITEVGGGDLYIQGSDIIMRDAGTLDKHIEMTQNGAVDIYYDNSKKFETNSAGIQVSGNMFIADGSASANKVTLGTGGDLNLYHDGTNSNIKNDTGQLNILGDDIRLLNNGASEALLKAFNNGAVELYYDANKRLETHAQGAAIGQVSTIPTMSDFSCQILAGNSGFIGNYHSGSNQQLIIGLNQYYNGAYKAPDNNVSQHLQLYDRQFKFLTAPAPGSDNGAVTNTQILRIDGDGIKFGTDTAATNALDDYEEGTFTPTCNTGGFGNWSANVGRYTKIGRLVNVSWEESFNGSGDSSLLKIGGLPFAADDWTPGSMYAQNFNAEGTDLATPAVRANEAVISVVTWGGEATGNQFGGYSAWNITYTTSS